MPKTQPRSAEGALHREHWHPVPARRIKFGKQERPSEDGTPNRRDRQKVRSPTLPQTSHPSGKHTSAESGLHAVAARFEFRLQAARGGESRTENNQDAKTRRSLSHRLSTFDLRLSPHPGRSQPTTAPRCLHGTEPFSAHFGVPSRGPDSYGSTAPPHPLSQQRRATPALAVSPSFFSITSASLRLCG